MRVTYSKKGFVACKPPVFQKIESTVKGGVALLDQKVNVVKMPLVLSYVYGDRKDLHAPHWCVILDGDSGTKPWAKKLYKIDGEEFCLVPESDVIGFICNTEDVLKR